jgi:glycosyltransferase involved in cell wall biosynthesis
VNEVKVDMLYDLQLEGHGGGTTHTMELFENLKKTGNVVNLFVPKPKDAASFKRPNIFYLPMLNIRLIVGPLYQLVLFFYYSLYRMKHTKPDFIYVRISLLTISPLILSKLLKIPYVVEINGLGIDEMKLNNPSKLIIKIFKVNEKLNYKHAKKIIAVTQGIKEGIVELYNISDEKIVVIENGVNTELFKPLNKGDVKYGLDGNYNYVGFSGSFARWHGLEDLIRSAPLILKEVENTKFLLVGDGPMKEQIIQMVNDLNLKDSFIFIDRAPYEEVPKYVNAFDVCVILKKKDIPGSPLKLWEYMACGKPVIATNTEDFRVLEENNAGILVDPEKSEEVADAIITLLKNKELRDEMGKNGRKYVVENRSWESVARRVAELCEQTVHEYKKGEGIKRGGSMQEEAKPI